MKDYPIVVTGGAGFIGSNIVEHLNKEGMTDIIVVDHMSKEKKRNLTNLLYSDYLEKDQFMKKILTNHFFPVRAMIHMGACSDTREYDTDYLKKNNYEYSQKLFQYCTVNNVQFLYASSGAVYGDGVKGYSENLISLKPLNPYGYYKYQFDQWVLKQSQRPPQWVGFRFFNVYGQHEYHKGPMASVILNGFHQIQKEGKIKLFKSYRAGIANGEQKRDFIYVKDVVDIIVFFLRNKAKSGIFNVGSGRARTFLDLAYATFHALGENSHIQFIDMPETLKEKYQYMTEADITSLRKAGYKQSMTSLEDGISDYVQNYLMKEETSV